MTRALAAVALVVALAVGLAWWLDRHWAPKGE